MAPFEVVLCPIGIGKNETVRNTAETLYRDLRAAGVDVILDDRDARPGIMFADWELIGVPLRVTLGERSLKDGVVEIQARRGGDARKVAPGEAVAFILDTLKSL